jgi:hypothetical protein
MQGTMHVVSGSGRLGSVGSDAGVANCSRMHVVVPALPQILGVAKGALRV